MDHEKTARTKHRSGYSCASSVYSAFSDVNKNMGLTPVPRSEGGRCGAVLSAVKTLREMGIGKADEFETEFTARIGSVMCRDLMRSGRSCNDCVGIAAAIADALRGERK